MSDQITMQGYDQWTKHKDKQTKIETKQNKTKTKQKQLDIGLLIKKLKTKLHNVKQSYIEMIIKGCR